MANATETPATPEEAQSSTADSEAGETQGAGPASFGMQSRDVLPIVASVAGLVAGISGQQPTGNSAADFFLSFAFVWIVVWFSQHAKPEATVDAGVLALFFSGFTFPAVLMAALALVASLVVTAWKAFDQNSVSIGLGVSTAFACLAALSFPNIKFVGSASLLAALTVAPVVATGFRSLTKPQQRKIFKAVVALGVLAAAATALAVIATLGIRDQVETGIEQAQDGVAALQDADRTTALSLLEASEENFKVAHDRLSGPMTWPARFVPITAQHSRALETAAAQGLALARTAARTGTQADVEKIRGSNGEIDLTVVEAVNVELNLANATMQSAQRSLDEVSVPWLVPQLSSRLDSVQDELVAAAADIDLANHATAVLPGILGADGARRYLVLFVQPAESREYGGFVGAYGILEADQGRLNLAESGSIDLGLGFGEAVLTETTPIPAPYAEIGPHINPQNLTATADLSVIAAAAREFVPQWRLDSEFTIDGVITIDPYALAGLLELAGPLTIEGRDEPLDASNVADYLIRDQYLEFDPFERDERQDILRVLAGQAFDRLFSIEIPGPERLGAVFGPLARADRLSFVTFDDLENSFLDRVFLSADMPRVGSAVDMVGIYGQTATASKLDGYATRFSNYDVAIDPATGELTGELTITEHNDAPPDANNFVLGRNEVSGATGAELPNGSNLLAFGLYTRADVTSLSADTTFRIDEPQPAYTYMRHPVFIEVPIGGEATVSMSHTWAVEPGRYDIAIPAQATANPAEFTLTVRPTPGWRVRGDGVAADGSWTQTFTLDESVVLTFFFDPTP